MVELIDKGALISHMLSQWDLQDLYMPVHFEYLVDEIPTVTKAEIHYKAITDFLQFVCDNANNEEYANEDGWAMSDLIDLEFKYLEQLKERE